VTQYNLRQTGVDVKLDPQPFGVAIKSAGTKGADFDIFLISWASDYPDPSVFINPLLDGRLIQDSNNSNYSYFDEEIYNRRITVAGRLTGDARFAAYGQLDVDLMRRAAPIAPILTPNVRELVSARTVGYVFHPVYQAGTSPCSGSASADGDRPGSWRGWPAPAAGLPSARARACRPPEPVVRPKPAVRRPPSARAR
jgi:ABC-type oligopeptide transport system substrate-binding subunit